MSVVRAFLAVALAVLLAGCTQIPTQGPVTEVSVSAGGRGVRIAPEPPHEGMSASRVLEGFLQAMADPSGDYAVAREYLSQQAKATWNPGQGAVVYEGWVEPSDLVLRGQTTGVIDAVGRFRLSSYELEHDFGLVQDQGQWRISEPPDQVLVSGYMFARAYATVKSYFIAAQGQAVIADILHLPQSELTPSRIIASQLAGPSDGLSGAVRSAIPSGVTLGPGGASVDSTGLVTVDLVGLKDDLDDEARRELGAQLLWSLSSISRVTALQILVDGRVYPLPGQNDQQRLELSSQQGFQPLSRAGTASLYGVSEQRPGRLTTEGEFVPIGNDPEEATMTAVSLDGTLMAMGSGSGGLRIGPLGGELVRVETGLSETRSMQFAQNRLWLQGTAEGGQQRIISVSIQGAITSIDVSHLPGRIVDFSLDSSGLRFAAIVEVAGVRVFGSAVVSQNDKLTGWREIPLSNKVSTKLKDFVALDWTGELDVALIASEDSETSVYVARIDGSQVNDIGPFSSVPVAITALPRPGGDAVAVRTATGSVLLYQPNGAWRFAPVKMSWISYPG